MRIGVGINLARVGVLGGDFGVGLGPGGLGVQAAAYLGGIDPYHWLDFVNNRSLYAGVDVGTVADATGYSFTRASDGTYRNLDGTTTTFASGALRRGDRGVLIEGARTNLFLNSATGATQSVTVTASAHTLSFEGTGTVTLTGVSTAGPLVGTGVLNRVSLTFTPTAGTLTLTISGTVERVNLEAGVFGSSWIPTTGTSATRAADILSYTAGVNYPLSAWVEFERVSDSGADERMLHFGIGTERFIFDVLTSDLWGVGARAGGADQAALSVAGTIATGTVQKGAGRIATNSVIGARAGVLSSEDTLVTLPANPTNVYIGASNTGAGLINGFVRRLAVFNSALSDAQLQTVTT
jgi:hypothetical protein